MNKLPKVTIGLVLYKQEKYLPFLIDWLFKQDYQWDIEYIVRDNDSEGSASRYLKEHLKTKVSYYSWENTMHSAWHNFIISKMTWDLYICASVDMLYENNFVSNLVTRLGEAQIATCKIRYWDFQANIKTNYLDSCWIAVTSYHKFYDIGQGKVDDWSFDSPNMIWPSWALFIVTSELIKQIIKEDGAFFDEKCVPHFKNDVDLWYRLKNKGIHTAFIPDVVVYHDRWLSEAKLRSSRSQMAKIISLKAHLTVLYKNINLSYPKLVLLKTLGYEIAKFIYILFFETSTLRWYREFWVSRHQITLNTKKWTK